MAAGQVANFFRQVLGMIAGALERLGHEDDLQAGLARNVFRVLDVAEKDQVAQAIHFGVGAEHFDSLLDVSHGKRRADGTHGGNFKSLLQQVAQREYNATPQYILLDEKGPDHSKCFKLAAVIGRHAYAAAWGRNKKDAWGGPQTSL